MGKIDNNNPWLGLESYQEGDVLYGRDDDIRDLIQCVLNDIDTLLYGRSGIGKSSILKAGIFPAARRNGYIPVFVRLSHKDDRDYVIQIKNAILEALEMPVNGSSETHYQIREIVQCKDAQSETLYEFFHRHTFHTPDGKRVKLLIVFDQFEEIFTLQSDETKKRTFFAQMADLLNDIMPNELLPQRKHPANSIELINPYSSNSIDIFEDFDMDIKNDWTKYITDNDIHFVFTIREDFLSDFEYYTASIPSLKHNRYALRPINEQQAAQIILRPSPELINKSVARLIIEKVTGRTDFDLNNSPGIEVDSAVLSLYMNRLYDSMESDGITADLIEQKGDEILSTFYKDAMADISESSVTYLEDNLINGQGRRDNITVYDAINKGGVTQRELDILCKQRKILRIFNYAGLLRIEYVHDILCPIVIKNQENRQQRKLIEIESKKLIEQQAIHTKKLKRRNKIISFIASILLTGGVIGVILYLSQPQISEISVHLSEDVTINPIEYWLARVSALSGTDTLYSKNVDKNNPNFNFEVENTNFNNLRWEVDFLIGDFKLGTFIIDSIGHNYNINIPILPVTSRTILKGKVASSVGSKAPLFNALVLIGDQPVRTNHKGEFIVYLDSELKDSTIVIRKNGYKPYQGNIKDGTYRLSLDRNYNFYDLVKSIQEKLNTPHNVKTLKGKFYGYKKNGDTISGDSHMVLKVSGDSIIGYSYYDNIYERESNKINSYFVINGTYRPDKNKFKLHLMDAVYNEVEYTGFVSEDSIWYGEFFDKDDWRTRRGYFILK